MLGDEAADVLGVLDRAELDRAERGDRVIIEARGQNTVHPTAFEVSDA